MLAIAIDGGTTNTRAVVLKDRKVWGSARRAIGARDRARDVGHSALQQAITECIREASMLAGIKPAETDLLCASGMLTSNVGLLDLAHVPAPVSLADLARSVEPRVFPGIDPRPIHFVRGVKLVDFQDRPGVGEMMRGEETEAFGILALTHHPAPFWLVLPGSHTKLILVDADERIVDLRTSLTGEMIGVLSKHTVLAGSLPAELPEHPDSNLVQRGADWARQLGLLGSVFQTRIAQILDGYAPRDCAALLIGMVIGADVADWQRLRLFDSAATVLVGGPEPLRSLYVELLRSTFAEQDLTVDAIPEEIVACATAVGVTEIVRQAMSG